MKPKTKQIIETVRNKLKRCCKYIISKVIPLIATIVFILIPFLHRYISSSNACYIWIPSAIIFLIDSIFQWYNSKKIERSPKAIDVMSRGFAVQALVILTSVFIINYFDTAYTWPWAVAVIIAIVIPFAISNMFSLANLSNKNANEVTSEIAKGKVIKYILFYWLLDAFYISIFTSFLWGQIVFGSVALLILLYSVSTTFLSQKIKFKWMLIHDFVAAIVLTIYLIFIIPNEALQNVVLVLVSAIYGGFISLVGVAWTIKDGKRQEAESRRLEKIPYFQATFEDWIVKDKRESGLPEMWINITKSQDNREATFGKSLKIANIGLGMATDIKCIWKTAETNESKTLPISILKCEDVYSFNIIGTAMLPDENSYPSKGSLIFIYKDLLGNQYNQTLNISFEIHRNYVTVISYDMEAPTHIEKI